MYHKNITSIYLTEILNISSLIKIIKETVKTILIVEKQNKLFFDTLVFTGNSGAIVVPQIATKLKRNIILIRKPEHSHSSMTWEGYNTPKHCLFIDDFIFSGKTYITCKNEIEKQFSKLNYCYFYSPDQINPTEIKRILVQEYSLNRDVLPKFIYPLSFIKNLKFKNYINIKNYMDIKYK